MKPSLGRFLHELPLTLPGRVAYEWMALFSRKSAFFLSTIQHVLGLWLKTDKQGEREQNNKDKTRKDKQQIIRYKTRQTRQDDTKDHTEYKTKPIQNRDKQNKDGQDTSTSIPSENKNSQRKQDRKGKRRPKTKRKCFFWQKIMSKKCQKK